MSGTKVQIKYGYGKPQDDSLKKAELAIDLQDNSLWTADADGNIVRVAHDTTEIEGQIEEIVKELTETVVHKNEDNVVEDQFSLRNEDYSLSITGGSYGEIFASFVAGQKIAVAGDGYRSIKYIYKRDGISAFQVVNADGSASMSISTNGVVQGQDYLDADGNSIIDKIQNNESAIGLLEIQVNGNTTDIGNLETDLGNLQGQVNENTGNISDLETDFGNLQGQVNENTTDIDNLQTDLGKLENRVEQNETDILYLRDDLEALDTDLGELQGQVNTNTGDIGNLETDLGNLQGQVESNIKGISSNAGDIADLRDEFENHDHKLNDLSDVNTGVPSRDDLLIFNGSNWVADDFAFIETSLRFKGGINMTGTAPSNPENGDLYVNDTAGVVGASWGAIAGTTVVEGKFVGWAEAKGRWYLLGDMASVGVTSVSPGVGISVDDKNPSEPVVSVDKTETDKWYEPKFSKNSGFNKNFGNTSGTVAEGNHTHSNYADVNHDHNGVYEPVINPKKSAFNKDFGTTSGTVAQGNHNHSGVYEPVINPKNSAFNKSFGTTSGTVAQGDHTHDQYLTGYTETDPVFKASPAAGITAADITNWNSVQKGTGGTVSQIKIVVGATGSDPNTLYFVV